MDIESQPIDKIHINMRTAFSYAYIFTRILDVIMKQHIYIV